MRSKTRRPLPPRRGAGPNQVLLAVVLVVVGATAALGFERLVPAGTGSATKSPAASATDVAASSASPDTLASEAPSEAPVDSATPSASPVAPILAAAMPTKVNGTALTVETDLGSTILGNDPSSRSFAAAVSTLGFSSDKLEIGFAYDPAGSLALTVLGFRISGVQPAKLRPLVLESWLSASAPGVKSANLTLSGVPVTKVSYGDEGSDEFLFVHGDAVFIVETADQSLAASVIATMSGVAPPASPAAPSGSAAAPSASPAVSASPASS